MLGLVGALSMACAPLGYSTAELETLGASDFHLAPEQAQRFLEDAMGCAGSSDPFLRDLIGYDGIMTILRGEKVDRDVVRTLTLELMETLEQPNEVVDRRYGKRRGGFQASFLTLYLVEFARWDRIDPILSDVERARLVDLAAAELRDVTDYRGFDQRVGWRHHVAHAADLTLQVALNPGIDDDQRRLLAEAIVSQVNPAEIHFYVYGEPGRLALPLLYLAFGSEWSAEEMTGLLEPLKGSVEAWEDAYNDQAALARLHNTRGFLQSILLRTEGQEHPNLMALREAAQNVLAALP